MSNCPNCGTSRCYNSGFSIECVNPRCCFYSEAQVKATAEGLVAFDTETQDLGPTKQNAWFRMEMPETESKAAVDIAGPGVAVDLGMATFDEAERAKAKAVIDRALRVAEKATGPAPTLWTQNQIGRADAQLGDVMYHTEENKLYVLTAQPGGPHPRTWTKVEEPELEPSRHHEFQIPIRSDTNYDIWNLGDQPVDVYLAHRNAPWSEACTDQQNHVSLHVLYPNDVYRICGNRVYDFEYYRAELATTGSKLKVVFRQDRNRWSPYFGYYDLGPRDTLSLVRPDTPTQDSEA